MKTLVIERPAYLDQCLKDLQWTYEGMDLRNAPRWILQMIQNAAGSMKSGPTALTSHMKAFRITDGAQVMVDERVSRDLEISSVIGSLDNIAWPADCLEIRFQDKALPSVIVLNQLHYEDRKGVAFLIDAKDGASITLSLDPERWKALINNDYKEQMKPVMALDLALDDKENDAIRYMALLTMKVLAYSSIPQHKPILATTREERKAAGIHPKHPIPKTDKLFSIRYLPRIIREKEEKESVSTGKTHKFLGRGGVLRYYSDERYVNMRGTWQWLPPIPPPEGIKITVKIRKV